MTQEPLSCHDNTPPGTALDHEGAVIWTECPTCNAARNARCTAHRAALYFVIAPPPGEVHAARMTKWLEFKRRVAAGAGASRMPHMQQFPRYPTKKVTP